MDGYNNILYYYCIIGTICILLLGDIHTFFFRWRINILYILLVLLF